MVRALGDADFCKNAANAYLQTAIYCNEVDKNAATQTMQFVDQAYVLSLQSFTKREENRLGK